MALVNTSPRPITSPQAGLTLVELLIAIVLGLFVVMGATQLYLSSQYNYRFQTALADIQDTGRFALDTLSRELRQAGYTGSCLPSQVATHVRHVANSGSPSLPVQVWTDTQHNDFKSSLVNPVSDQHAIAFRGGLLARTGTRNNELAVHAVDNDQQLSLSRNIDNVFSGQLVLLQGLQNCDVFYNTSTRRDVLQKSASSGWLGNVAASTSPWGGSLGLSYAANQQVSLSALSSAIYYIGRDPENRDTPALMRLDISQTTPRNEVLASNIVAMRTHALIDGQYLPPEQLSHSQWTNVQALRISLIARSDQSDLRHSDTSIHAGNFRDQYAFTVSDGRLYRAFTTTIALRNH